MKNGLVVPLARDSDQPLTDNLDRKLPLSYEHTGQRRYAPTTGNLKPKPLVTITDIRTYCPQTEFPNKPDDYDKDARIALTLPAPQAPPRMRLNFGN